MSLDFLKTDAEYPGFIINKSEDFVKLINSFRLFDTMPIVTLKDKMTIITLEKI